MAFFVAKPLAGPRDTAELRRILSLPQRDPDEAGRSLVDELTEALATPEGTMRLLPLQALALSEAFDNDGCIAALPVGSGKTLISYLLPVVMFSERAVLLVPGKLHKKTILDFSFLSQHWENPKCYYVQSYEYISTHPRFLDDFEPDLIVADEAHKLKNLDAACTRRVIRYWEKGTSRFCPLTGTFSERSFLDFWHLQLMALPVGGHILPTSKDETQRWGEALDSVTDRRASLGALSVFGEDLNEARKGYGQFIKRVPSVITADSAEVDASLFIEPLEIQDPLVEEAYSNLENTWCLPNGFELETGPEFWRHAREIAAGFFYIWKTQPPIAWAMARKDYGKFVRDKLARSRTLDTVAQIDREFSEHPLIKSWKKIEKSFTPETIPIWFSPGITNSAVNLSKEKGRTLLWYHHRAVGDRLSEIYGLPTYRNKGLNIKDGSHIYECDEDVVAVSDTALFEGFNLQPWNSNVVMTPSARGIKWEQILGRTHRPGQKQDEVNCYVMMCIPDAVKDFHHAIRDAKYASATTAQKQKLLIADYIGEHKSRYDTTF